RPDAAGHRGDRARHLGHRAEVDVARETLVGAVDPDVDDRRPRLHHVGGDHAGTPDRSDEHVRAVGRARMITADMVKPGATVIDVGINRTDEGLAGDVDFGPVADVAGAITPVPGGVGPMTIAMLLRNTVVAANALHSA